MNFDNFELVNLIYFLPLVILLLIFASLLVYRFFWKNKILNILGEKFLLNFSPKIFNVKLILMLMGVACLIFALLRPRWGKLNDDVVEQEGRDLLIALDISRSMLAQDFIPNRLIFAKAKIKKIVDSLKTDRVGLMPFSESPFVLCPLTNDYDAFFMYLDSVDSKTLLSGSTSLEKALEKAISVFSSQNQKKNKIVVVLTDGEDFSTNLLGVKQKAEEIGLRIFTIGIGSEQGAPIPIIDDQGIVRGYEKNSDGSIVVSKLNEPLLQDLSYNSGAIYIKAVNDDKDISSLISKIFLFEKEKFDSKKVSVAPERYYYFAIVAFLFFVLEWLL